jgi:hypothetical protein
MTEKTKMACRICKLPLLETEFGVMCRGALGSWKWEVDHWRRSFAGHPEVNPDERRYLEKHGQPGAMK